MEKIDNLYIHYSKLLGIEAPWQVDSVKLDIKGKKVEIKLSHEEGIKVSCPECEKECSINDHTTERSWRHLDTMQFQTILYARVPRSSCKEHGVKTIKTSWSEPYSRFTLLFTRFAIEVLLACGNLSDAVKLLNLSWDEGQLIQEKAVERGLARRKNKKIDYLGIDEKSYKKGRKFITVLNDLDNGRVLDVVEGKSKETTDKLLSGLSKNVKKSVKAIAMDMAEVFVQSAKANLPNADIVFDRFHISKFLNEAVHSVWKSENNSLHKQNDDSLSGSKFVWLKNPENFTDKQKEYFQNIKLNLYKVGRAWQLKQGLKFFWEYSYKGNAKKYFDKWYFWATHSRLKPMIRAARSIKNHLDNIMTYFDHHITNATSEGLNSKIQLLKANARGFRNFKHYRIAILFKCGDLSLYP